MSADRNMGSIYVIVYLNSNSISIQTLNFKCPTDIQVYPTGQYSSNHSIIGNMETEEHAVIRIQLVKSILETLQEKMTQFLQEKIARERQYKSTQEEVRRTYGSSDTRDVINQ